MIITVRSTSLHTVLVARLSLLTEASREFFHSSKNYKFDPLLDSSSFEQVSALSASALTKSEEVRGPGAAVRSTQYRSSVACSKSQAPRQLRQLLLNLPFACSLQNYELFWTNARSRLLR